jgi:hypothetical protein
VVEAVLKASPDFLEKHGKIHIGNDHGFKMADLRTVWKELAAVGDAELVSVESDDQNVKVMRKGDLVQVFVDQKPRTGKDGEKDKGAETVRVEVPTSLVDAFLSGNGEEATSRPRSSSCASDAATSSACTTTTATCASGSTSRTPRWPLAAPSGK